jgi:hypothetical protein
VIKAGFHEVKESWLRVFRGAHPAHLDDGGGQTSQEVGLISQNRN